MSEEATLDEFAEREEENTNQQDNERHLPEIDEIPSDWRLVVVEDIAEDLIGGGTPSKSNEKYWGGRIPWASVKDLNGIELSETEDYITESGIENSATNLIPKNSIVVSTRMTVGEPFVNRREMAINQDMKAIIPDVEQVNPLFLIYSLWDKDPYLKSLGRGTTVDGITTKDLALTHLGLPSLSEQRKIATVLYTVDRAIEKTEEVESQARRTQKGIVQETLQYGLGESDISETGTKLGEIPAHWELTTIDEIVADEDHSFTDGARSTLSSAEIHDEGEARAILLQEVGEGEFNDEDPKFATAEKYEEITHRAIYPGEVVVAKMAEPVARACIVPDKYDKYLLGCADVVRVQTNDEFDSRFLMYCMNSHKVWRQAVAHLRGTGRSRINLENIAELKLPKPPLDEQIEIADALKTFDDRIQTEREYRESLRRLKRGLMQDLLSGTVRTTDTNIEVPDKIAQHG